MNVLQRSDWYGEPEELRTLFALTKASGARARIALWTHHFGWELKLFVKDSLIRSQVFRDAAALEAEASSWRKAMVAEGWSPVDDGV